MTKHITLLSFICILLACTMRKPKSDYAQLIQGDWLGQRQSDGFEHDQTEYLLFEDSSCRMAFDHDFLGYEILEDSLYIKSLKTEREPPAKFTIVKLTADSLILLSGKRQENITRYSKILPKNNITPAAIYFASAGGLHDTLVTHLEIDSNRNVRFYGDVPGLTAGGYTGKLSEVEYNVIISKIRNLPVDSLQDYYAESGFDLETFGVAISHDNKVIRSTVYGHQMEPIELNILLTKLMYLAQEIHLQPDSSVKQDNFIRNPQLKSMTKLLVPPITMRKFTPPKPED